MPLPRHIDGILDGNGNSKSVCNEIYSTHIFIYLRYSYTSNAAILSKENDYSVGARLHYVLIRQARV